MALSMSPRRQFHRSYTANRSNTTCGITSSRTSLSFVAGACDDIATTGNRFPASRSVAQKRKIQQPSTIASPANLPHRGANVPPQRASAIRLMLMQELALHELGVSVEFLRASLDVHGISMALPTINAELRQLADRKLVAAIKSALHPQILHWVITELGKSTLTQVQGRPIES